MDAQIRENVRIEAAYKTAAAWVFVERFCGKNKIAILPSVTI